MKCCKQFVLVVFLLVSACSQAAPVSPATTPYSQDTTISASPTPVKPKATKTTEPTATPEKPVSPTEAATATTVAKDSPLPPTAKSTDDPHKTILFIVGPQFNTLEFQEPRQRFERSSYTIRVAAPEKIQISSSKALTSAPIKLIPDLTLAQVQIENYAAVVFIGGSGAKRLSSNPEALQIAQEAARQGVVIGSICLGTNILAKAGLVEGKRVAGADCDTAEQYGAIECTEEDVVIVDGLLVTTHLDLANFASQIMALIEGTDTP